MKLTLTIIALVAVLIAVYFNILKTEPVFTGKEYDGESLTANLLANPVTFTDTDGNLVDGHAVRYYAGTEKLYSKASFKDGVMHGPFLSFWDNGQMQMTLVWDKGTHYKNMRTWNRDGKRLRGTGDEQMAQIRSSDKQLGLQMDEIEKVKLEFAQ